MFKSKTDRTNQVCRTFEVKLNHPSKEAVEKLNRWFLEAKWVHNDMVVGDLLKYKYQDHPEVKVKRPKGDEVELITLPSALHQSIVYRLQDKIKTLSTLKKKGQKVGRIRFKSEINSIPLRSDSLKVINSNRLSLPGFTRKKTLRVRGMKQFYKKEEGWEVAGGTLLKKSSGFYIHLLLWFPPAKREKPIKEIGIDFGIKTAITTSEGKTYNTLVGESEHLKKLQRKFSRQKKGSNNQRKTVLAIRKEYEYLTNKRNDLANKVVHDLLSTGFIYFQDEQIKQWKDSGNKGWGRRIHHNILGRVKTRLDQKVSEGLAWKVPKWKRTTKTCVCGEKLHFDLSVRTFTCPHCGYSCDRDIHAAKMVLKFGSTKRAQCSERTCVSKLKGEKKQSKLIVSSQSLMEQKVAV